MSKQMKRVDARGEEYPIPLWMAEEGIEEASSGETVEFVTDMPSIGEVNIPTLCKQEGYDYEVEKRGADYFFEIHT